MVGVRVRPAGELRRQCPRPLPFKLTVKNYMIILQPLVKFRL